MKNLMKIFLADFCLDIYYQNAFAQEKPNILVIWGDDIGIEILVSITVE